MTTLLEKADTEYRQIKERRRHLREEELRLRETLRDLQNVPRSEDRQLEVSHKLRACLEEQRCLGFRYEAAKQKASQAAAQRLMASPAYRKAVLDAAIGWVAVIDVCRPLENLTQRARCEGVGLPALPPTISAPAEVRAWVRTMIAAGVLDPKELSAALKGLVEEGER